MVNAADMIFQYITMFTQILIYGFPFILLAILFILKIKWKGWPLECVIIEKRGNNLIYTNDRAGKFTDKYTGLTGYRLCKSKESIPVLNYEWILHNAYKPPTIAERIISLLRGNVGTLFLFKYGTAQYKPIWITKNNQRKKVLKLVKDKNGEPVFVYLYEQFDPRRHLGALNFEVIDWDNMNFMIQEMRATFERRQKKKDFWRQVVIPLAAFAVTALVCLFMIKFSYDLASSMSTPTVVTPNQPAQKPDIPVISDIIP